MGRNVVKSMDRIFNILREQIADEDQARINEHQRHIHPSGNVDETVKIVRDSEAIEHEIEKSAPVFGFKYEEKKYIVVLKFFEKVFQDVSFTEITFDENKELFEGAGMLAIFNGYIPIKKNISSLDIIERCWGTEDDDNTFEFKDICSFFDDYSVFEMDDHIFCLDYIEDFYRLEALSLSHLEPICKGMSQSELRKLLMMESSRSISLSIINGLKSNQWEYSYLQLYQCLEYLFSVHNAVELKNNYSISDISPAIDISSDNILKKSEKESLMGLISKYTSVAVLDNFCTITSCVNPLDSTNKIEKIADYIYKIRCNLAHLRFRQDSLCLLCSQQILLSELLVLIVDTYESLDDVIKDICLKKNAWQSIKYSRK